MAYVRDIRRKCDCGAAAGFEVVNNHNAVARTCCQRCAKRLERALNAVEREEARQRAEAAERAP